MVIKKKYTLNEIDQTAEWLLQQMGNSKVVALTGNMGAGKTTLISAVCRQLGVTEATSSPTFSIINEYSYQDNGVEKSFFHIDLYRLKDEQEAMNAGVEDCIYSGDYCFVEWPEKAPALFPPDTIKLHLQTEGDTNRSIELTGNN